MARRLGFAVAALLVVAAAAWALAARLLPDRPRVPEGEELIEPDTVEVAEGDPYVGFAGTDATHARIAYARESDDGWEVVVADAVTGRKLSARTFDDDPGPSLAWNGPVLEVAERDVGCRRAFVVRPPAWRFEPAVCTDRHGQRRRRDELPPDPIDLRPATQCDPSPTVKAPGRRLWAVEVCTDQGLREPDFAYDVRLVDADGDFVAQYADLFAPAWAADGSLLALSDHGHRLQRVPRDQIE